MYFKIYADINWPNAVDGQGIADYNWQPVYDPESDNEFVRSVYNSSGSKAIGESGSLTFTIPKGHPLYGIVPNTYYYYIDVLQTTVIVTVTLAGDRTYTIWTGRVISIDTDFMMNKVVQCEGALSYLGDIIARPYKFESCNQQTQRDEERSANPHEYMTQIMSWHTAKASAKRKANCAGIADTLFGTTVSGSTATYKQMINGNSDYVSCKEAIDTLVGKDEHAALIPYYTTNGIQTGTLQFGIIDITHYRENDTADAVITFHGSQNVRANLISSNREITGNDIFTVVIPLDKDKERKGYNDAYPRDYTYDSTIAQSTTSGRFGVIEKVINYDDISVMIEDKRTVWNPDTQEYETEYFYRRDDTELSARALSDVTKMQESPHSINIQAVDLSMIDPNQGFIDIGSKVQIIDDEHALSGNYIVTSIDLDFGNPGATSYTLYPIGFNYMMNKLNKLTAITAKDSKSLKTGTDFENSEGMYNLVKVNKGYVKVINQNWTEHYKIEESGSDGEKVLITYKTVNGSN